MSFQRVTVNGPKAVPVVFEGDEQATVKVAAGSTIRYGYTPDVTTSSYAGSITLGNELEFTRRVWIISADKSEVEITIEDTVEGTPLDSVANKSEAAAASLAAQNAPGVIHTVCEVFRPASATYYTYPPRVRPPETGRQKLIIRNIGVKPFQVGFGNTTITNFDSPNSTEFNRQGTVYPGQEWEGNADPRSVFCRPSTSGDSLRAEVDLLLGMVA